MTRTSAPGAGEPSSRTLEILKSLVGFNTTSRLSNLELIDFVYESLKGYGLQPHIDHSPDRSKANLYAIIGPQAGGGIALSGHSDVVPVEGQAWTRDPWVLSREDGRLYGRGTTDMKGFLAVVLAAVPAMLEPPLREPIHLCISYDEEVGCVGVRSLLEYLADRPSRPKSCIVGEPTSMDIVTAHKGRAGMHCRVKGRACHSSLAPYGVNAVHAAARAIGFLMDLARRKQQRGPFDQGYDVPYSTIHTGIVRGGSALNIVPEECEFEFEIRHLPEDDPGEVSNELKAFIRESVEPELNVGEQRVAFEWTELPHYEGLNTGEDEEIVRLVRRLLATERIKKVGFGTEAGGFSRAGIRSLVCGPGSIGQAHTADEFIEVAQLAECERFIGALIQECSGGSS